MCPRPASRESRPPLFESLEPRRLLDGGPLPGMDPLPPESLFVPCDVTGDGRADGGDLAVWQQNYDPRGLGDKTYFEGDMNGDRRVDGGDLALWQQNYSPAAFATGAYADFNRFCTTYFGAEKEPLAYDAFGDTLGFVAAGDWRYASVESACVAFETNLPAWTYVQFGETTAYGRMTCPSERPFGVHVHALSGLQPGTLYHYRLVAMDERRNIVKSEDRTFTTGTFAGALTISGNLATPYALDRAGARYVLTGDVTADSTAFNILAKNVTLDLNGHTITYDNVAGAVDPTASQTLFGYFGILGPHGVRQAYNMTGARVFNGFLVQGPGNGGYGSEPLHAKAMTEVAGLTLIYRGSQVSGAMGPLGSAHHNVALDLGTVITNRSQGVDAFNGDTPDLHHNLVKRVRHRAISASSGNAVYDNEICMDSWATNAFGVFCYQKIGVQVRDNRIYGGGYDVVAIGTVSAGTANIDVSGNFIHLQATAPNTRSTEYGAQSDVNGTRVTWDGDNLTYHDNFIAVHARDGGRARGVWMCPDPGILNVVYRDNVIKAIADNTLSNKNGAVCINGWGVSTSAPCTFINNRIISNFSNVCIGDSYGGGHNAVFTGNVFVREGSLSNYRTIEIGDNGQDCYGHRFIDSTFEGGAGYDRVLFESSGRREFTVEWTLTVHTTPGAAVTVRDAASAVVFAGTADAQGVASTALRQYLRTSSGMTYATPHSVTVELEGRSASASVTMDRPLEITLTPPTASGSGEEGLEASRTEPDVKDPDAPAPPGDPLPDPMAPTAPSAPDLLDADDTGVSNTDNLTSVLTPRVRMESTAPGATVQVICDRARIGAATHVTGTTYEYAFEPGLMQGGGTYRVWAEAWDGSRSSQPSPSLLIQVDTAAPVVICPLGSLDMLGWGEDIDIAGGLAYVADGNPGLQIVDISNPAAPVLVGACDPPVYGVAVTVAGDLAFLAGDDSLQIIDVSNPSAPVPVGVWPSTCRTVNVVGSRAYVSDQNETLWIVDVSVPASLMTLGHYTCPDEIRGVDVLGHFAYLACEEYGLLILDVSDPEAPAFVSRIGTGTWALEVDVVGTTAFVACSANGLAVVDVSTPSLLRSAGYYTTGEPMFDVCADGDLAYVVFYPSTADIIDVSGPAGPIWVGTVPTAGDVHGIDASGGTVCVLGPAGLQICYVGPPVLDLDAPSDTGASDADGRTYDVTPTLSTNGGGPYVRVYRDGVLVSGEYETGPVTLGTQPVGTYSFTAQAVDAAGNVSELSAPLSVTFLAPGDANEDGKVDGGDLALWQQNYNPLGY